MMSEKNKIVEHMTSRGDLLSLLDQHHLLGLFFTHYPDHSHSIKYQEQYQEQYKKQWIHNHILLEEIQAIDQRAQVNNTTATLLKGSHLLLDLYSDPGSRFMSDIDFLISKNDILTWEKIMRDLGFMPNEQKSFYGNNYKSEWCKTIGEIEVNIELHTKLFFHHDFEDWTLIATPYGHLTKLSNEDLYLHLCGHLAFQHNFLKLNWLFDIYLFHQKFAGDMDWDYLSKKAHDYGLFRSVQMCLWILKSYFNLKLDQKILDLFDLNISHWWQKFLTIEFLIQPYAKKFNYLIIKHATKDRLILALRYDLTWFFHYKIKKLWQQ